ncbi:hypothetical protein V1477_004752 [Vespula maculifrons]|uniref:Uncharacterized protein n=1 Tax=Vespula maculifrons TaxID=7453 RepID=A0ABD2CMQ3_VESMC
MWTTRFYPTITSLIPKALLREAIKKLETLYDLVGYISKEVFYLTFPFTFMHSSLMHKLDTKDLEIIANPLKMDGQVINIRGQNDFRVKLTQN